MGDKERPTSQELINRLPRLPMDGCMCSCGSSNALTSQSRRQETAELRKQWQQMKAPKKIILRPKMPEISSLPSINRAQGTKNDGNTDPGNTQLTKLPAVVTPTYEQTVPKRPNYVLRISLPAVAKKDKWRENLSADKSNSGMTKRQAKNFMNKDSKYFFVSPELGNSERRTLERFQQSGQLDALKFGWM